MMEWLAGLDLEKAANAVVILVTGLAVGLGFRKGRQAPPSVETATQVELQGALVDSSSIKQAAIEISNLGNAAKNQTVELRDLRHSVERMRDAVDRLAMVIAASRN